MRRYNRHSAGSLGWPFPMINYTYIFEMKDTEGISSNSTRKLLWFGGKGSPYSITERRVPELIPVLVSQPAGDVSR